MRKQRLRSGLVLSLFSTALFAASLLTLGSCTSKQEGKRTPSSETTAEENVRILRESYQNIQTTLSQLAEEECQSQVFFTEGDSNFRDHSILLVSGQALVEAKRVDRVAETGPRAESYRRAAVACGRDYSFSTSRIQQIESLEQSLSGFLPGHLKSLTQLRVNYNQTDMVLTRLELTKNHLTQWMQERMLNHYNVAIERSILTLRNLCQHFTYHQYCTTLDAPRADQALTLEELTDFILAEYAAHRSFYLKYSDAIAVLQARSQHAEELLNSTYTHLSRSPQTRATFSNYRTLISEFRRDYVACIRLRGQEGFRDGAAPARIQNCNLSRHVENQTIESLVEALGGGNYF